MAKPMLSWMTRDFISAQSWQDAAEKLIAKSAKNPDISGEMREDLTEAWADLKASRKMMREIMAQQENIVEDHAEEAEAPTDGRTSADH